MKVVEVIPSLNWRAGAETFFVSLCKELNKSCDLYIIILYNGIDSSFKEEFKNFKNVYFCDKKKGLDYVCAKKFRKIICSISPDIIHTHLECLATYFLSFGLKKRKWKIFHTCHSIAEHETSKFNVILRRLFLNCNILTQIAISPMVQKSFYRLYGEKKYIPVIFNGIEIPNPDLIKCEKKYDLVICARFTELKNHSFLIQSLAKYNEQRNEKNTLLCLGDGPTIEKNMLLSSSLKLDDLVYFKGSVNDVSYFLKQSKIFVLVSSYKGNPISILEAMSYGLPVIASNVGGIPDVIKNEKNGYLFSFNNYAEFEKAFDLLKNENIYDRISKENIKDITSYSICNIAKQYLSVFVGEGRLKK